MTASTVASGRAYQWSIMTPRAQKATRELNPYPIVPFNPMDLTVRAGGGVTLRIFKGLTKVLNCENVTSASPQEGLSNDNDDAFLAIARPKHLSTASSWTANKSGANNSRSCAIERDISGLCDLP